MPENRYVYLKNNSVVNTGFKKTRNVQGANDDEQEAEYSKLPNESHQDRLRRSNAIFYVERKQRKEQKKGISPATIDIVIIKFYKTFNQSLQREFLKRYGLIVSYFEDFNKTVAFEISDFNLFNSFLKHIEMFYESPSTQTYEGKEYNLIALIHDFKFLSSKRRLRSFSDDKIFIGLIPPQNENATSILKALNDYLESKNIGLSKSSFTAEIIEASGLSKDTTEELIDNFDIIRLITSTRTERRRPGLYGEVRREYGFTVTVSDKVPLVGVIDTGMFPVEPLKPVISEVSYDLTNTAALIDDSGHGTAIAGLVALGEDFVRNIRESYVAKARISIIKAIQNDNDSLNYILLGETIKDAKTKHGIRIFNLSLNDYMHKRYNEGISDYAFLLDKIAYELDVLIVISVGNIRESHLNEIINNDPHVAHEYPNVFYCLENRSEVHSCELTNISAPSESLNNLSIGAIASNLEGILNSDITPAEEFPAYYSRKFHYDYEQTVNGVEFMRSQKNKHLNKPDLVFDAGDLFGYESGMEILRSPIESEGNRYFSKSCGTSLAAALVTSLAAEILTEYPVLRTQTVKALLINSATSPCGNNPAMFRGYPIDLLRKLIGFGRPNRENLTSTDDNSVTFIIEDVISLEELRTIEISLPHYINKSGNKLNFKATLTYDFLPIKENHLGYLPLQITFGIFSPISADEMGEISTEQYRIKNGMTWSDDFFGVDNRLFSNVQQRSDNLSGEQIAEVGNKVSLAIKCTSKNEIPDAHKLYLKNTRHKFSLVLTITELPTSRANNILYQEITAINTIEQIVDVEGEAIIE